MIVVVNTSPLIALDRIGCLFILPALYGNILRPQAVIDELTAGKCIYTGSDDLLNAEWMTTVENPPEMALRKELGDGETAAIIIAHKQKADLLILDDLAARNVAREMGLTVTGTVGTILAAYKKGIIKDVESALSDLRACGFHISDKMYNSALRTIEQ